MARTNFTQRVTGSLVLSFALFTSASTVGSVAVLSAQARGPVQRVVQGTVQDKNGVAIKGAVVYLQDSRTNSVKSAIALDNGSYRFVQLTQGTDYSIWAKSEDKKSATKTISSFDTKNELTINLKID
ncbi:carboxypeptidase-like regulatory domain-containing protein [Granulicella tundricola]|uniref:Carboxypeptidase regulatory-like domain-containing protein n=1 Tax=Granulicella tundricola (strain ATCC BAA-1859 / DSM 23138 / MP5ACTX9) TaxID=1198114 RepID=E8X3B5_GRATM|nr:carboxypeptidase-like regulatory domain-containing protein [Granulicella tundricola]ADW70416.1 hypothetical protein AciX9_3410 [Granulicella tundricola MP5ACTX9]